MKPVQVISASAGSGKTSRLARHLAEEIREGLPPHDPLRDDATEVQIAHSKLAPGADRAWVKDRWEAALDRIESDCL